MCVVVLCGCTMLTGCEQVLGLDSLVADRADDGTCTACGTPGCGACPDDSMIDSGAGYLIDALEVTNSEYRAFLDSGPVLADQLAGCIDWNDTFEPGIVSPQAVTDATNAGVEPPVSPPECGDWLASELSLSGANRPVACVDWCDASAYCAWAGKRLCGKIGGGSVLITMPDLHIDPAVSEWYRACSNVGTTAYPYGDTFELGRCVDVNSSPNVQYEVGSFEGCEGGYPGLFDMSGNAGEWTNECSQYSSPHAAQNCLSRGGAYYGGSNGDSDGFLRCDDFKDTLLSSVSNSTGFRCCADPG